MAEQKNTTAADIPNMQSIIERQASLESQISEEIKKYNDELQRVVVSGTHGNTKQAEKLKQKIASELSKATLEDNREKFLQDLSSGVSRTSFEPSNAADILTHHIAVAGQKRNVRVSIDSIIKRFFNYMLQTKLYERNILQDRMNTKKGKGDVGSIDVGSFQIMMQQFKNISKEYKDFKICKDTFDLINGKPVNTQKHLKKYVCWLIDQQNISFHTSIFGKRLQCQDIGNRVHIYEKIVEIGRNFSNASNNNNNINNIGEEDDSLDLNDNTTPVLTVNGQRLWNIVLVYMEYFKDYLPIKLVNKINALKEQGGPYVDEVHDEHVGHLIYEVKRVFDDAYINLQSKFVFASPPVDNRNNIDESGEEENQYQDIERNSSCSGKICLYNSDWINDKFLINISNALSNDVDDVTNLFEKQQQEGGSGDIHSQNINSDDGDSTNLDKLLLVEQEFLSEKNLEIVKERLKHEVTTCNVRTIARKRRHDVGTLEEDATAIFDRKSNENDNGMYIDNNNTFEAEDDEFGMKDAIPLLSEKKVRRISESVKNRIEILYNLRFLKTLNCKRRLLSTLNYFKAVEKRLSHDFIIDDDNNIKFNNDNFSLNNNNDNYINDISYLENRMFSKEEKQWHVRQPYDNFDKMYDSAIITLQKLEQSMLEIGSSCIQNFEASSTPSDEYDHNNQQQHVVDRAEILADLYDCEDRYQLNKSFLVNILLKKYYLNLTSKPERKALRDEMLRIIYNRPSFYNAKNNSTEKNNTCYFKTIYNNEVQLLKSKIELFNEIVNDQMEVEKNLSMSSSDNTKVTYHSIKHIVRIMPIMRHVERSNLQLLYRCYESKYSDVIIKLMSYQLLSWIYKDVFLEEWNYVGLLHNNMISINDSEFNGINSNSNCIFAISNKPTWNNIKHACFELIKDAENGFLDNVNLSKQAPPGIQTFYNVIESLLLREELILLYFESEFYREYYNTQREYFGREIIYQDERVADEGKFKPKQVLSYNSSSPGNSSNSDNNKSTDITANKFYSYPLAINNFQYKFYSEDEASTYDYRTINGVKNIIDLTENGLKLLRVSVKAQAVEQSLLLTIIRHNQIQIDEIQLMAAKKNTGSFFITENEKSSYRMILRELSNQVRPQFFSLYRRKSRHHEIFWASYALRSKQFKRESNDQLRKKLMQDLKLELVEDLCNNMIQEVEPEMLRYQTIVVCEDLERITKVMRDKAKEQFEDTIFYTNVDYMNNLMSSINGKNPKSGDDDEEEPKLMEKPESFLIGNYNEIEINNVWYIPNRTELLKLWDQDDSIDSGETKRDKRKKLMNEALILMSAFRDIFWLIKVRCHFFSSSKQAGTDDVDVLYDTMKYEWSKFKFYLEQQDAYDNSRDSDDGYGSRRRRNTKDVSTILIHILRFRTFLYLILRTSINEIFSKCINNVAEEKREASDGVFNLQKLSTDDNVQDKICIISNEDNKSNEILNNIKYNKRVQTSVKVFSQSMLTLLSKNESVLNAYDAHHDFITTNDRFVEKSREILQIKENIHAEPLTHTDHTNYGGGGGSRWFWTHLYKVTYTSNALAIACLEETSPLLGPGYSIGAFTGCICNTISNKLKGIVKHTYNAKGTVRNYINGVLLAMEYLMENHVDNTNASTHAGATDAKNKISSLKSKVDYLITIEKRRFIGNAILDVNNRILKWKYINMIRRQLNSLPLDELAALINNCLSMKQVINIQYLFNQLQKEEHVALGLTDNKKSLSHHKGASFSSKYNDSEVEDVDEGISENNHKNNDLEVYHLKKTIEQLNIHLNNKTREYNESILSEQRNVNGRVASRCYALLFSIDALKRKLFELKESIKEKEAELMIKARAKCLDEIEHLKSENIELKGKFEEYKETLKIDMLGELAMANRMAMAKILDNDTIVTNKLKQRTVKVAKAEEDVVDLKQDLSRSKREMARLRTDMEQKIMKVSLHNEKKLNEANEKLNKSEGLWSKVTDMEKREEALKQELVSVQSTAIEKNEIIKNLKQNLKLAEHTKNELLNWKISQTQVLTYLRNEIEQYKNTNNNGLGGRSSPKKTQSEVDIIQLQQSADTTKKSLHRANQAVIQLKRELDREKKLKRKAFQQIAIMKEKETKRKIADGNNDNNINDPRGHGNKKSIDYLANDYNDLSENYRLLYVQNEQLRTLLRDHDISPPMNYPGPLGLSERRDWKYTASRHGDTGVDLEDLATKDLKKYKKMDLKPWGEQTSDATNQQPQQQLIEPQQEQANFIQLQQQLQRPQTAPTNLMDKNNSVMKSTTKKRGKKLGKKRRARPKSAGRMRQKLGSSLGNNMRYKNHSSNRGNMYGSRMAGRGEMNKLKIDSSNNMHNSMRSTNGVAPVSPLSKRRTIVMKRLIDEGRQKNKSRMSQYHNKK